ncbi:hypothetical protein EGH10_11405 [Brevibacillus laterosporus]|nr:hypothetical protein D8Z77_11990 [Brevibacillus laterosporus]RJL10735.1 hypothetical protein DM460_11715 [Brevibacillus laterosporus]TPH11235.1 hypothetical protein EGH10_11405 [Brevibacillus laterosporus]
MPVYFPPVVKECRKLTITSDLMVCDGQGHAHSRRALNRIRIETTY